MHNKSTREQKINLEDGIFVHRTFTLQLLQERSSRRLKNKQGGVNEGDLNNRIRGSDIQRLLKLLCDLLKESLLLGELTLTILGGGRRQRMMGKRRDCETSDSCARAVESEVQWSAAASISRLTAKTNTTTVEEKSATGVNDVLHFPSQFY
jgi:hypothetical protein